MLQLQKYTWLIGYYPQGAKDFFRGNIWPLSVFHRESVGYS